MNNKDLSTLEYDKFKDYLLNKFTSDYAKKHLNKLCPLNSDSEIKEKQSEIKESIYLISIKEFNIPDDSEYTSFILKLDDPLSSYEPRDFLSFMNFHKSLNQLKKELLNTSEILNLKKYLSDIHSFGNLIRNIDSIVDESGRIKDSASEKLTEIRQNIKNNYQIINKKLNNILNKSNSDKFLQEKLITTRNNRFTLMCKSNFRQYIKGIVHDLSDSGQTFFVEPEEIIEINNQYQQYKIKENKEIISIIKKLIREIHQEKELIFITISAYEKLIFCLEIALFYKNYQYCFPELSENLEFNKIHHPLILFFKKDESIPIDINITKENKLAVITGPNTGGKTAALKSIGLNTLIAKSGLPIFGQFAKIHVFNKIFADIGDEQSIQMDLSTFSSHMLNIKRIIENISEDSLVLFDELGTGTEPKEGAFLAISILDYLIKKDVTVIITTHFSEVKHYARQLESATIYSVGFDYDNFKPSYNLIEGVEGKSDPLLIAKKLNFLEEIIKKAEDLIAQNTSENELLLEEINDIKLELSNKLTEIDKRLKSIKEKQDRVREKEERLNTMLNKKEIELLEETYMLLNKAKSIIKKKTNKINENELSEDFNKVKSKLNQLKDKRNYIKDIKVNDIIYLEKYNKQAKILRIEKNKVFVDMEGLKVFIDKKELVGKKITKLNDEKQIIVNDKVVKNRQSEIVLVGKTVEEAEEILDSFIDTQVLAGIDKISIIHGRGSGALRQGIHKYLKNDKRVKSFRLADLKEGGPAITIVNL